MITFKSVRYKNFLSTGNNWTEIPLDINPNTLIVGENGSGKSTILDALRFGLYGKAFRNIRKPQLVNSINNGDCLVEVKFKAGTNDVLVRRGLKPNKFDIEVNGTSIDKLSHTKDFQELLETQILKMNDKAFTQVVILGSSTFVPFMQLPAQARRDVIEDLLDIEIFSQMNTVLKGEISTTKEEMQTIGGAMALEHQLVDIQTKNLQKLEQDNQASIDKHNNEIELLQTVIVEKTADCEARQQIVDLHEKEVVGLPAAIRHGYELDKLLHSLNLREAKVNKEIAFYNNNPNCPKCTQDIDESFKKKILLEKQTLVVELAKAHKDLGGRSTKHTAVVDDLQEKEREIGRQQSAIKILETQIDATNQAIGSQETAITELNQKGDTHQTKVDVQVATAKLETLSKEKEALANKTETQKLASQLLKDNGIKTLIIKQYLPIMNKLVNSYLAKMDFFVNFELDENFNETIKSRHRDDFSYSSFSEGEKLRLDLALLLTWRAIAKLKNSTNTNLLILDEVFDSSLDDAGTQEFLKILHTLTGQNTFVISHRTDIMSDKFLHCIEFQKVKDFSKIV